MVSNDQGFEVKQFENSNVSQIMSAENQKLKNYIRLIKCKMFQLG